MDIILHLTRGCQLDCTYCYGGRKQDCAMSWDVARRAIDMLFAAEPSNPPGQIRFFGGEPLLELPLLKRCVDYAKAQRERTGKPFRLGMTTNGLAVDDELAAYLKQESVEPTLSMDGVAEAQDACRRYAGGRSSFADTERALSSLLRQFPNLTVCAVVSPANVEHLPASLDYFLAQGVRRIVLNPDFFGEWDDPHLEAWRRGYECAAQQLVEEFRAGRPLHINVLSAKIITHLKGGYEPCDCCDFGQREVAVAPSGNLYPCQRLVREDVGGFGLIGTVFSGRSAQSCRDLGSPREEPSPECLGCSLRRRCRNWCSCVNHRLTGGFRHTGPLVCFHERMAIELADRAASQLFAEKNETFLDAFYMLRESSPEWV
ncbi:MAG: radical SAM protein [Thermoguttaceae bacterium]